LDGAVRGPGGADVVGDQIVFHGWINDYTARGMYVAALGWADGYPAVRGSRVRYEAERGTLNHCAVRATATASQGQAVASGWETWRQVRADVTLDAGHNTVRLTHRGRWAELDFVESPDLTRGG
jgi:hypothetical protein